MNMRQKLLIILFTALLFINKIPVSAQTDVFGVNNHTKYEVTSAGQTLVTQTITFTNLTDDHYVPDYELTLGSGRIENIWAIAGNGNSITFTTTQEENITTLNFDFHNIIIDPHAIFSWDLNYESLEATEKNGQIYEITIPQIANIDNFDTYDVELNVSKSLGNQSYISPTPSLQEDDEYYYKYKFSKEDLKKNTVSAAFGSYQIFDFTLKYKVENTENYQVFTEIPFPADKNNQQVILEFIDPEPVSTRFDEDGNVLAYYLLDPNEKFTITLAGYARVWLVQYDLSTSETIDKIPEDITNTYTKSLPYWEASDKDIKKLSFSITDDKNTVAEKAQAIFDYVRTTLKYSDERLTENPLRYGAKESLENTDQAVCMEYTDLYIALARASGIPARELDGYAYNADNNIGYIDALHAWVEVYIPPYGWMPIDPTWSSTASSLDYFNKLDTNHLVFVTKGISSETPYPPGTYKPDNTGQGNILVSFSEEEREHRENISLEFSKLQNLLGQFDKEAILSGIIPQNIKVLITNNSNFTIYNSNLEFLSDSLNLTPIKEAKDFKLPPYGKKEITASIKNPAWFKFGQEDVTINFTANDAMSYEINNQTTQTFILKPFLWDFLPILLGIIGGIMLVGTIITTMSIIDKRFYKKKKNERVSKDNEKKQKPKHTKTDSRNTK